MWEETAYLAAGAAVAYGVYAKLESLEYNPGGRVVVVTGCDSGFGKMVAAQLSKKGMTVYATCLSEENAKKLSEDNRRVHAMRCDVTKQDEVDRFAKFVEEGTKGGVWALINNAGLLEIGPVDWLEMEHYDRIMQVNFLGVVRMTKAMLPFLQNKSGRVINISSVAGLVSVAGMSAYSASKYAVEAFSDALRSEAKLHDMKVVLIEPALMKTPMVDDMLRLRTHFDRLPKEKQEFYGGQEWIDAEIERVKTVSNKTSHDPQLVVDAMIHAVLAKYPQARYKIGPDAKFFWAVMCHLPGRFRDLVMGALLGSRRPSPKKAKAKQS